MPPTHTIRIEVARFPKVGVAGPTVSNGRPEAISQAAHLPAGAFFSVRTK